MNIIPMFAVAVPFTARLMAYFKYPYVEEYAGFILGILFVVVLLLAFVAYMDGPFDSLIMKEAAPKRGCWILCQGRPRLEVLQRWRDHRILPCLWRGGVLLSALSRHAKGTASM